MNKSSSSRGGRSLDRAKIEGGEGIVFGVRLSAGVLVALLAGVVCMVLAPGASATPSRAYESSFGSFTEPEAVTVDQSNGDVYVVDIGAGTVSRFTSAGAPAEFSATKTNVLGGFIFESGAAQVAVAPAGSPGGTAGDIYVVSSLTDNVEIFDTNGSHIGELNGSGDASGGFGEACGVATEASTGAVYVGDFNGHVWRYTPTSGTVTEADYSGGIATSITVCNVAADSGSVYAGDTYEAGELRKYQASAFATGAPPSPSSTLLDATATSVAVDPANGDVYVDEGDKISVFDSSGVSLYGFGSSADFGSNSAGVGVGAGNGKAYVADAHAGGLQVDVYAPAVSPPTATTNPASTIHHTDAVLNGHLDPGGDPGITACHFDWGATTAYTGGTVPCNEGNSFTSAADVTANLNNLAPGVQIHFRLDITGATSGAVTGADETFTPPPFLVAHAAIASFGPDGTSATLFTGTSLPIAFDQADRRLYVLDPGIPGIYGFDASAPPSFPGMGGFSPLAVPEPGIRAGLAVDNTALSSAGNLYLSSRSTDLVYGFDSAGAALGGAFPIDPTTNPGAPSGSPKNNFGDAVDSAGNLWVVNFATQNILEYSSAGVFQTSVSTSAQGSPEQIAFDSNDDLYVALFNGPTWKYTAASGYTASTEIDSGVGSAIAVDPSTDHLYVAHANEVSEYDSAGNLLSEFATGISGAQFRSVAVDATNHDVYVSDQGNHKIRVFGPGVTQVPPPTITPQDPSAITAVSAVLHAAVDPEGIAVTDCHFDYGATTSYGLTAPCVPPPGSGSGDVAVSGALSGLEPGATYHFRIVASNANPGGAATGPDQTLTTVGPQVHGAGASQITTTEARLSALVDPEGKPTSYHFDYGTTASYGSSTPESASVGSDSSDHAAVKTIGGLLPGTTYHFRVVATNADGVDHGADTILTTYPTPTGTVGLPDGRVYELVTNPDEGDAEVYEPNAGGQFSNTQTDLPFQAAVDGDGVAYVGSPSVGGNEEAGSYEGNQYLARRSTDGAWTHVNLSPVGFPSAAFEGFSSDLSVGLLDALEGMTPGAPGFGEEVGVEGNYDIPYTTSTSGTGNYAPLITATPPYRSKSNFVTYGIDHPLFGITSGRASRGVLEYAGASADSSHVVFEANDALTPNAEGGAAGHYAEENNLYESVGGQLRLVNVLPDNSTKAGATFGAPDFEFYGAAGVYASPDFSHVISNDGSRVFWTDLHTGHIYVRENGTSTVEISAAGKYWTASADGSRVFYTNGDLYEYEVESGHTTDLTPGVTVRGVIGASEDGDYVYYVTAGFDLDMWHNGTTSKIKTLTAQDSEGAGLEPYRQIAGDWRPGYGNRMAEVSPDGHGVVFMSTEGEAGVGRVDVYDADSKQLYCASCGSRGSKGFVPLTYSNTYLKRWISEDGSRVFFDSREGLVPQDTNGKLDAYEWERPGSGSCKASTGCLYLLSGGTSKAQSYFADASASGNDVFIVTRAKLLSRDDNELFDLYDVRVGGVEPVSTPVCTGTGCQGVPGAPPIFATPSSATFEGLGNFAAPAPVVKAKPKPKKKVKKKPRPKHKAKHKKVKKGSKASRRAGNVHHHGRSSGTGGRS